ncbi:CDP-alcohol phosphatidyltransferase family protein [Alishewanella sp. SMS8]|uniref:CDP-alcohol phosphatidyltransferase family protein n=1 Tax=Alishewanella sp. SMS8 TaxID=2994676 RepID=UPI00274063A2|nr:CDP-alcohol phosphatidyltransferase family protein [Alishewanella sp. SMS8]MDP5458078.1 CDP-alcohol phosphatidyltransferase family protein [Alishewanella sp. SMS8]
MLDAKITPLLKPLMQPLVKQLDQWKISPNQLTVLGFLFGMLALPLLAYQNYTAALLVILLNRVVDGLDGALARWQNSSTASGGFLDISLDFLFYAAIPLGFALADPTANALAAAVLLASFIGTGSSFLAFAIPAERYQLARPQFANKSFYYLHGLTEGTETILLFVAFCVWPQHFSLLAYCFAFAAGITIVTRVIGGFKTLRHYEKAE